MDLAGAVCVVTGGGNGIGAALVRRFAAEGAAGVVVVDLDADGARRRGRHRYPRAAASPSPATSPTRRCTSRLVAIAEERFGPVDLYCSNAGIGAGAGLDADIEAWNTVWRGQHARPRARRPGRAAVDARPWPGLPAPDGVGRRTARQPRRRLVHRDQARRRRVRRVAVGDLPAPRHRCVVPVPDGRRHRHAAPSERQRPRSVAGTVVTGAGDVLSPDEVADARRRRPSPTSASSCSPTPRSPRSCRARSPTSTAGWRR